MPTHLSNLLMAQDKCSYFTILNYTVVKDSAIAQCRKNIKFTRRVCGAKTGRNSCSGGVINEIDQLGSFAAIDLLLSWQVRIP